MINRLVGLACLAGLTLGLQFASPTFGSLGLGPALERACARAGYVTPTPVQLAVVPACLSGADLRVCAPTGSGKSAAFALPVLQALLDDSALQGGARSGRIPSGLGPRALVVVPTRELAAQV